MAELKQKFEITHYQFINLVFMRFFKKITHFLLAWFAYWRFGRPARKLIVIGVTGTKGKSTTCRFIASVLEAGGYKVGLMSTVEFQIGDQYWPNDKKMTMLGRGQIQIMLRKMVDAGCRFAVIETSSEGILQYRHYGLDYDVAVFTNLGAEHIERHGGFENLKKDKGKLFASLFSRSKKIIDDHIIPKAIVANGEDSHADYYLNFPSDEKYVYGTSSLLTHRASRVFGEVTSSDENGSKFLVQGNEYTLNIIGDFNISNALAAIAVGRSQNIPESRIAAGLAKINCIPGRMEFIEEGQSFKVVVDYAHEALSFNALFNTLRKITAKNNGKVIAVIGSDGGGRDVEKRGNMGKIAGTLTDIVIITDVNCYNEDPKQIAEMLAVGARQAGKKDNVDLFVEVDRRQGIAKAISLAKAGDVVAITAKGTEPCIVVAGGKKIPWDDRKVTREVLSALSLRP